jgi:hypothetical protein
MIRSFMNIIIHITHWFNASIRLHIPMALG